MLIQKLLTFMKELLLNKNKKCSRRREHRLRTVFIQLILEERMLHQSFQLICIILSSNQKDRMLKTMMKERI